jgi:hypothetical protein
MDLVSPAGSGGGSQAPSDPGQPTSTSLTSSSNPSSPGQEITFTATVFADGGTPTGTVEFDSGSVELGTAASSVVNGQDQATFSMDTLSAGTHSLVAVYNGDTNYSSSTSAAVQQAVDATDTTTTLSAAPQVSVWGQAVKEPALATGTDPRKPC